MKRTTLTLTLLAVVATVAAMAEAGPVRAAAALSVTKLECGKPVHAGQFDAIYIVNQGDAAQDLAGWQLRSDPDEPPDYAKLFDPAGSFVAGMDCTGQALGTTPTPTPAPPPPQQASGGG